MSKNMGYILIAIGLVFFIWGLSIVFKSSKPNRERLNNENEPKLERNTAHENDTNKLKGDSFEKFVVKHFDKKYFTIQEWRGDKYIDGTYAVSNHFPDLEVLFKLNSKGISDKFAIECKWRKNYYQGTIEWAKHYQITNYKKYSQSLNIPVYIVIGIGGEPENPNELFIVPLAKIENSTIQKTELTKYHKSLNDAGFYWDFEKKELK